METHRYGPHSEQVADLRLPVGGEPHTLVVLIHGGFWRDGFARDLMDGTAEDLTARGYATWNLEYRRGAFGGAWPNSLLDVAAGIDALSELVHPERVVTLGHSAGGQLALWAAARPGLPPGTPGSDPQVAVAAAISLGGVCDLVEGERQDLGGGAVAGFLGGPVDRYPERATLSSPIARLPLGVPQLLVHGHADDRVPASQSIGYGRAAQDAGDSVELLVLPGVDHFAPIDPETAAWHEVVAGLERLSLGPPPD
ncbi:MAG: alpha/beta hydrolase family protein [Acidimicrobiia bacterium]